jgi:hypothetical protein
MEFRTYDPAIGRFNGIDPVTHHSQGTSVAFDNNPIYWADPSGANSSLGLAILGLAPFTEELKKRAGFSTLGINGLLEQAAKNDKDETKCPNCDNPRIILDFVESTAIKNGTERAEQEIKRSQTYSSEVPDRLDDITLYGTMTMITGDELKYDKKWYEFMHGDNDTYEFNQKFSISTTEGEREFSAKALMRIYENVEENNIKSMSLPITSGDGFGGTHHIIRFFNSQENETVRLTFKNKNQMSLFFKSYYSTYEIKARNMVIKNYKNPLQKQQFKH